VLQKHVSKLNIKNKKWKGMELGPGDGLLSAFLAPALGSSGLDLVDSADFANKDTDLYCQHIKDFKSAFPKIELPDMVCDSNIEGMLAEVNGKYHSKGLESLKELHDSSYDLIFSQAVLEHVRYCEFVDTMRECYRLLTPEGVMSHVVDFKNHLGGGLNNMRFSSNLWEKDWFSSYSGFYTNRIRLHEMVSICKDIGFKEVIWSVHADKVKNLKYKTRLVVYINSILSHTLPKKIIFCSKYALCSHTSLGFSKKNSVVINNGINVKNYNIDNEISKSFRKSINVQSKTFLIGCIARWDIHKDHETLIQSAVKLKSNNLDFAYLLVGDNMNSENTALIRVLNKYKISEKFILCGRVSNTSEVMNAIDTHVLTSISESFGNVVAEAMLCGTVCIVTDIGMPVDIIGSLGKVINVGDVDRLSNSLIEMISERAELPNIWNGRKINLRRRIKERFSLEKMIKNYINLWEECLKI
jgi:glycosyltransferase involved in cell wall biosynthesis